MTEEKTPMVPQAMVQQGQRPVVPQFDRAKGDLGFSGLPAVDTFVEHADPAYKPINVRRK